MGIFQKPTPISLPPRWQWMANRWLLLIPQALIVGMALLYFFWVLPLGH